jgi:hypothetical protein
MVYALLWAGLCVVKGRDSIVGPCSDLEQFRMRRCTGNCQIERVAYESNNLVAGHVLVGNRFDGVVRAVSECLRKDVR